jgi:hypothetical protein
MLPAQAVADFLLPPTTALHLPLVFLLVRAFRRPQRVSGLEAERLQ